MTPRPLEAQLLGTQHVDSPRTDRPAALAPQKPTRTTPGRTHPAIDWREYELPEPEPTP
jgi:hypothetical protein